jgi:hypothetical protein
MESNNIPFKEDLIQTNLGGFETDIHKFQNDDRYIIKTLHAQERITKSEEVANLSLEEFVTKRYVEPHRLFKEYFGRYLPETSFVIGHEEASKDKVIYIVQEKITGEPVRAYLEMLQADASLSIISIFSEVAKSLAYIRQEDTSYILSKFDEANGFIGQLHIAKELDNFLCRAMNLWADSRDRANDQSTIVLSADRVLRYKNKYEGLFPELSKLNLINGVKHDSKESQIYLIDNGVIGVPDNLLHQCYYGFYTLEKLNRIADTGYFSEYGLKPERFNAVFHSNFKGKLDELRSRYPDIAES